MSRILRALENRLLNMIGRGDLKELDDGQGLQVLTLSGMPGEELRDVERVQNYGFTGVPSKGHAVMVFPQGDRNHAIVIALDDVEGRLTGLSPDDVAMYDVRGTTIKFTEEGVEVDTDESVRITAAKTIKIETIASVDIQAGGAATVKAGGSATVEAGGSAELKAGGSVDVEGESVTVTGGVVNVVGAAVAIEAATIAIIGALLINGIPYAEHVHSDVQSGSSDTGPPVV